MSGPSSLQATTGRPRAERMGPRASGGIPWRAILAAVLVLTLVLGVTQDGTPSGRRTHTGVSAIAALHRLNALPVDIQAAISRTLGADQSAFQAQPTKSGYRLTAGHLSADFTRTGVNAGSGAGSLFLTLQAIGHGGALRSVGAALPRAHANTVGYDDAGVQAWYAAGPLGIEQGFTLARRPVGGGGPLTLALGLRGKLSPRLVDKGRRLLLSGSGGQVVLRYGGLAARDAYGHPLHAWLSLSRGELQIRIADRGATYPLHIDPFLQVAKLTAADGAAFDELGSSVAVSGTTVVAGAPGATIGANAAQGAAYVFTEPAGGWSNETQAARLTASDGAADNRLGGSVAISGTSVVAGAPGATIGSSQGQGAAYVFTEPGGGWSGEQHQAARLTSLRRRRERPPGLRGGDLRDDRGRRRPRRKGRLAQGSGRGVCLHRARRRLVG